MSIDFTDLDAKLLWAIAHDKHAKSIMEDGIRASKYIFDNGQQQCYMQLTLLELSRLETGFSVYEGWLTGRRTKRVR